MMIWAYAEVAHGKTERGKGEASQDLAGERVLCCKKEPVCGAKISKNLVILW